VLWLQDNHRARLDGLPRRQLKIIFSQKIAKNHEDLQHRVVGAYTAPWSASKRQVSEWRVQSAFGETLGVEGFGVLPVAWRMVRTIYGISRDDLARLRKFTEVKVAE
jgi:hypothetical protein